jgi:hypothetical protein
MSESFKLIVVCYVYRKNNESIRIISARRAQTISRMGLSDRKQNMNTITYRPPKAGDDNQIKSLVNS